MPALTWSRPARRAQMSACEEYSICAIGQPPSLWYEAWRTRAHPDGPGLIRTRLPNAEAARKVCSEHKENR